jgi:two-component system sensor histidine kinase HydH
MSLAAALQESSLRERSEELFQRYFLRNHRLTAKVFAGLMIGQWVFAIFVAAVWSPYTWAGKVHSINVHVPAALILGGLISSLPIALCLLRPEARVTRYVLAVAQMLWSALLIHLTGGRIETHFHVFGSLAFIAFFRDWRLLIISTVVVATDHLLRGIFWPESVYGVLNPEWWRFLEHAGWVAFEDVILIIACVRGVEELRLIAFRQAENESIADAEQARANAELARTTRELQDSHEALTRAEKLAAVGQLAASVGHELRNPLGAVRNALAYVQKRITAEPACADLLAKDKRLSQFFGVMEHELGQCSRIISDLLDFARERPPSLAPCPLRPLAKEAIALVPAREQVQLVNEVPVDLPVPQLDKDQFRQVMVNLVQNASEAIPLGRPGTVHVGARALAGGALEQTISDDGAGIPETLREKIFEPLFTTKTKGTGLGLAIVRGLVERHRGSIDVQSEPGLGTTFTLKLPAEAAQKVA